MPTLSEYNNVYDTALYILSKKGFDLWYDDQSDLFWAQKRGWDFASESPCGLLGLVAIFEEQQPEACVEYWWKNEIAGINHRMLPRTPPNYSPVRRS